MKKKFKNFRRGKSWGVGGLQIPPPPRPEREGVAAKTWDMGQKVHALISSFENFLDIFKSNVH